MGKFGALAAKTSATYRVQIIDPLESTPIVDKDGKSAFIEVMSNDSETARTFDRENGKRVDRKMLAGRTNELLDDDPLARNAQRMAKLTVNWYLVDPETKEQIDVPFSEENAVELYSSPDTAWLYRQAVVGSGNLANFMQRSPKS